MKGDIKLSSRMKKAMEGEYGWSTLYPYMKMSW